MSEDKIAIESPTDTQIEQSRTQLQVSSAGKDCEDLLHKCIDGDYALLPAFAVKVWEWFAETPPSTDPAVAAGNVGQKAALLLFSMNAKFQQQAKASSPVRLKGDGPIEIALLVCSGIFMSDPYMWAVCVAWASMRLLSAMNMMTMVKRLTPLPECVILAHAYFVLNHSALLSACHACAWYSVWHVKWKLR